MALGYDGALYILAFDHRGSFQKKFFGISGREPTEEESKKITDAKTLVYEGLASAADKSGEDPGTMGGLVDEQFGGDVPHKLRESGLKLAMPVEKSGQDEFDFEYGEAFGEHIEKFDPDFTKVLVRYNPDADAESNQQQLQRLRRLSDWLHERDRKFLFELLVPAEDEQLESVGGDSERYDVELRPELMRRAIAEIQSAAVEPDIWKIEGVATREDNEMISEQTRAGGRSNVKNVVLGRGADDDKVDHWLRVAAPVPGFIGFAIGRSNFSDPLKAYLDGDVSREDAARQIGENYLRFVRVYQEAEGG
jgi:myo-inositol catabolism protein IolC